MLVDTHKRRTRRFVFILILGLLLGGVLSKLAESFLPVSAAREFLTTSVKASLGPLSIDLVAVSLTIGPLELMLNVLTLLGIGIMALVVRSWI